MTWPRIESCAAYAVLLSKRGRTEEALKEAAAALEAGEAIAKYALHEKIVAELIKTAKAAGNDDRAAYWKQRDLEATAARETLKALAEEE